jgi:hypothetical protein
MSYDIYLHGQHFLCCVELMLAYQLLLALEAQHSPSSVQLVRTSR